MMDSNSKAYETALAENPDKAEQKLLLIIHRAMPCFDFLKVREEGGREGGRRRESSKPLEECFNGRP